MPKNSKYQRKAETISPSKASKTYQSKLLQHRKSTIKYNSKAKEDMLSPRKNTSRLADKCLTPIASATPSKRRTQRETTGNLYSPHPVAVCSSEMANNSTTEHQHTPTINSISPPALRCADGNSTPRRDQNAPSNIEKESKVHDGDVPADSNDYGAGILSPNSFLNVIFSPVLNYVGWGEANAVEENESVDEAYISPARSVGTPPEKPSREELMSPTKHPTEVSAEAVEGEARNSRIYRKEDEEIDEKVDGDESESGDDDAFNPYAFIKSLPPHHTVVPETRIRFALPPKESNAPRISLVLDLDETLVHCSIEPVPKADLTFPVNFNGVEYTVYVRKRPYFEHFLRSVCDKFEVTIFTASQQVYAKKLLDILDPEGKYIKYRLYRDSCLPVEGNYLKDLTVLGRDLAHTVLVDNSPHAFGYQVENGIPIESWFDDDNDTELLKLLPFLNRLQKHQDVRGVIRNQFKLHDLIKRAK